jgi:hypothetical protein
MQYRLSPWVYTFTVRCYLSWYPSASYHACSLCMTAIMHTANHTYEVGKAESVPSTEMQAFDDGLSSKEFVPKTYQGTAADRHEMSMLGKKQVLRRQFKFTTMLGFASTVVSQTYMLSASKSNADSGSLLSRW